MGVSLSSSPVQSIEPEVSGINKLSLLHSFGKGCEIIGILQSLIFDSLSSSSVYFCIALSIFLHKRRHYQLITISVKDLQRIEDVNREGTVLYLHVLAAEQGFEPQ